MPLQGCVVCSIQYSRPFTSLREALSCRSWRASVKSVILAAKHECKACSIILTGFSKINPDWARSPWTEIILATSSFPSLRLKGSDSGNDELNPDFYVHNPEILTLLEDSQSSRWWKSIRVSPEVSQDPDSAFKLLLRWLDECNNNHELCWDNMGILPTRLIDVRPIHCEHDCQLVETAAKAGNYIALSYCWGTNQTVIATTTASNLANRCRGFNMDALPKTFQDAIDITRKLGIKFLWIDALCIIQDNSSDWEHEAVKMSQVYGNAYLTLAATASSSSSGGLYAKLKESASQSYTILVSAKGQPVEVHYRQYLNHATLYTQNGLELDPLSTRAWSYQERLLSRRIVHFTTQELLWECRTHQRCECRAWDSDTKELSKSFLSPAKDAFQKLERQSKASSKPNKTDKDRWHVIVEGYSTRRLTYLDDRLPAFSSIASAVIKPENFLAGLRKDFMALDLAWMAWPSPGHRPPKYSAPSWSWASLEAPIIFGIEMSSNPGPPMITVLDSICTPSTSDPFGRLSSGRIIVKSSYAEAELIRNPRDNDKPEVLLKLPGKHSLAGLAPDTDMTLLELPLKVNCVMLWREARKGDQQGWAMVVRRIEGDEVLHTHERLGIGLFHNVGKLPKGTFTII